jgi:hypothetical protein
MLLQVSNPPAVIHQSGAMAKIMTGVRLSLMLQ